jgi:hypothetical protein
MNKYYIKTRQQSVQSNFIFRCQIWIIRKKDLRKSGELHVDIPAN